MNYANCWDYDKIKYGRPTLSEGDNNVQKNQHNKQDLYSILLKNYKAQSLEGILCSLTRRHK